VCSWGVGYGTESPVRKPSTPPRRPMPRSAAPGSDPRSIVTPHAFTVAPDLLGAPLAHPMRRLGVIPLDLLLVALLTNAGGVLLGIFAALFLFRMATRPRGESDRALRRALRGAVGCVGSVVSSSPSLPFGARPGTRRNGCWGEPIPNRSR
jgi:hypothetical protein